MTETIQAGSANVVQRVSLVSHTELWAGGSALLGLRIPWRPPEFCLTLLDLQTPPPPPQITRTWIARDPSGNVASPTQVITVLRSPAGTGPVIAGVPLDASVGFNTAAYFEAVKLPNVTATDTDPTFDQQVS
jgi:hypothetical protein